MLAVVCYWYDGGAGYTAEHVNILRRMVARNLSLPHEFWCVGDNPNGLDPEIKFYPCDRSLIPLGGCYVKLEMWRREAETIFGKQILLLDLDTVICGSLDQVASRTEDVVLWRDPLADTTKGWLYNGSLILMNAGARPQIWEEFDPATSPAVVQKSGLMLGEQAWIGLTLGPNETTLTAADGVLSYKFSGVQMSGLPRNAAIVFFHGFPKPWQVNDAWVKQHWQ